MSSSTVANSSISDHLSSQFSTTHFCEQQKRNSSDTSPETAIATQILQKLPHQPIKYKSPRRPASFHGLHEIRKSPESTPVCTLFRKKRSTHRSLSNADQFRHIRPPSSSPTYQKPCKSNSDPNNTYRRSRSHSFTCTPYNTPAGNSHETSPPPQKITNNFKSQ